MYALEFIIRQWKTKETMNQAFLQWTPSDNLTCEGQDKGPVTLPALSAPKKVYARYPCIPPCIFLFCTNKVIATVWTSTTPKVGDFAVEPWYTLPVDMCLYPSSGIRPHPDNSPTPY